MNEIADVRPALASDEARVLASAMAEALLHCATDDAERLYTELCAAEPRAHDMKVFPMLMAAQRNRLLDFYRGLREVGEDHHPEIQALCLQRMGDPTWEALAQNVESTSADPLVKKAMRQLQGRSEPLE